MGRDGAVVEKDLSPAGASWAGWTVKVPIGVHIQDNINPVTLSGKEMFLVDDEVLAAPPKERGVRFLSGQPNLEGSFYVDVSLKKADLAALKARIVQGANELHGSLTFLHDDPGDLEWISRLGGRLTYQFALHMKLGDRTGTCSSYGPTASMAIGEFSLEMDTCRSMARKK